MTCCRQSFMVSSIVAFFAVSFLKSSNQSSTINSLNSTAWFNFKIFEYYPLCYTVKSFPSLSLLTTIVFICCSEYNGETGVSIMD